MFKMGNIQNKDVQVITDKWGNKPCNHPTLSKEYILGSATGDYVCDQCGRVGYGKDWNKKKD
jgi:hypothetical protein